MKKKAVALGCIALFLAAFLLSPLSKYLVSLSVMKVYSAIHEKDSIMAEKGIELSVPGGGITKKPDWYPFVMTFNDDAGFRRFTGDEDLKLTILYNFPAFDLGKGCSRLYDTDSPYYNGFYGAYLVCREQESSTKLQSTKLLSNLLADGDLQVDGDLLPDGDLQGTEVVRPPYGFLMDKTMDLEAAAQVPQFDFQNLVLRDFGIDRAELVFDWRITGSEDSVSFAGSDGWTRVDAALTVNGVIHEDEGFCRSYLQYGPPRYGQEILEKGELLPFAPVEMMGRVYGKYFEEWDTSIFFYVLASDQDVLEKCDQNILSKSRIGNKNGG